jgi:hypothetical protein
VSALAIAIPTAENAARPAARLAPIVNCLIVTAMFAALTAIFFWPLLPHLSSALLGPPEDNMQDFWNSWYAASGHDGNFFYTHLLRYPEGVSLHYHSFAYPQVAAVWGLSSIFGTSLPMLILLQNITILASFPLAGTGAFYLCRHLSGSSIGAALGGFVFAFNPWHVGQALHHAHVAGIEFLPFFVLCYLIAQERRSLAWLAGSVVFYALSALSCWYFLFYCLYFLAFHLLYLRVRHRKWPRGWPLAAPALCVAGMALLLSPILIPMLTDGLHANAYRPGSNIFVADLLAYTAFPPTHLLGSLDTAAYALFSGNAWEGTVYLGLVNLAVLAWALWRVRGKSRRVLFFALGGMLFFLVLASGDALHWGGRALPIHLPNAVLSRLPFFANVRTPARAIVFVYLFLGVAMAVAAATALKARRHALPALIAVLMLLDFMPTHLAATPVVCAPELAALARDPAANFGVLDLPNGYAESNFYMMQQACHGRPIAQGTVSRQLAPSLMDRLETKDLAAQRRQLAQAGIKYILLHRPQGGMFHWTAPDGDPARYRRVYPSVLDGPDMTILQVY